MRKFTHLPTMTTYAKKETDESSPVTQKVHVEEE